MTNIKISTPNLQPLMFKGFLATVALMVLSVGFAKAQFVSPNQLKTILRYWQEKSPEHVDSYITTQIERGWKFDPDGIVSERAKRSISFLYTLSPGLLPFGMITLVTQYFGDDVYNKAVFTTDYRDYYDRYLSFFKVSGYKITSAETDDEGVRTHIYKGDGLLFILRTDPPNEKGVVIYSIIAQKVN